MTLLRGLDRRLLIGFLLLTVLALTAAKLASEVMDGDTMAFDKWLIASFRSAADPSRPVGPEWLLKAIVDLTALGGWSLLTLLTIGVAGFLVALRKSWPALFVVASIAGGGLAGSLLKLLFQRARPDLVPHLVEVTSASFPSAHAMNSAVTYLTLAALLGRTFESRRVRIFLMTSALLLTLMVGLSRIYLGVHWPTDVAAGWIIGAAWAIGCSSVARILQERHRIEQPDRPNPARTD